jgi:hypothetical protein
MQFLLSENRACSEWNFFSNCKPIYVAILVAYGVIKLKLNSFFKRHNFFFSFTGVPHGILSVVHTTKNLPNVPVFFGCKYSLDTFIKTQR